MGWHPVISPNLEKTLSAIQESAEEMLEVLKSKKKQVEQGEPSVKTVPKLIGHIEKMEAEEIEERQLKVQKMVEDCEIPPKQEMVDLAGPME